MAEFGTTSTRNLRTCHPDLQKVARKGITLYDFSVLYGHRGQQLQNQLFAQGASELSWPESKHNRTPSEAMDLAPWPIDWGEDPDDPKRVIAIGRFYYLAGIIHAVSEQLGITLRWGGDWDSDGDFFDQTFNDLVHYELVTG